MSHTAPAIPPAIPYASPTPDSSSLWKLVRLGLILWASVTLLRHGLYWTNAVLAGDVFAGSANLRAAAFGGVECVLLLLFLLAAVSARHPTPDRVRLLGSLGGVFVAVVFLGAVIDLLASNFPGSVRIALRQLWVCVARIQVTVIPLLCSIALLRGIPER